MELHAERTGEGPTIVLVHGFTQTGRSWAPVVPSLAPGHEVVTVDAPGHGGSSHIAVDLVEGAHLLVDAGGIGTYVGYSMGARLCLHAALAHPDHVQRLVLISGTAGLDTADGRAERRTSDRALADRIARIGVDAFLEEWLALPLFAGLSRDAASIEDRRRNTGAGLRSSLELAGTGTQSPLWARLPELTVPVLLVAGAEDPKFVALADRMAQAIDGAELHVVAGAGHSVHLEQPGAFAGLLLAWLARHGG